MKKQNPFSASVCQAPSIEHIEAPPWHLWVPRSYCRIKHAVMLSLDLAPGKGCRRALAVFDEQRFQEYRDRLAIARARAGHDLPLYENHFESAKWEGEKVVRLTEFLAFAERLGWADLHAMRAALAVESGA